MPTNFPTQQQQDAFGNTIISIISMLPRIMLIVALIFAILVVLRLLFILILRLFNIYRIYQQETILLQLIPPTFGDNTQLSMQELFKRLHGWDELRTLVGKLTRQAAVFTLEIVGTRMDGIRFVLRIPKSAKESFEKDIASLSTDIRTQVIKEYLPNTFGSQNAIVLDFRQTGNFAYPLNFRNSLDDFDPAAALTEAMTKLAPDEMVVLQMVLSPTEVRHADKIYSRLLYNNPSST